MPIAKQEARYGDKNERVTQEQASHALQEVLDLVHISPDKAGEFEQKLSAALSMYHRYRLSELLK